MRKKRGRAPAFIGELSGIRDDRHVQRLRNGRLQQSDARNGHLHAM